MMEIKSVRIRNSYADINERLSAYADYKVSLFSNNGEYIVKFIPVSGNRANSENIYKRELNFTDNDYINKGIEFLSKRDGIQYVIIQDPFNDIPPIHRNFGNDPYYLNNGSFIKISWRLNNENVGGVKWSDENGKELKELMGVDKSSYSKMIEIYGDDEIFILTNEGFTTSNLGESKPLSGLIPDMDIIKNIIDRWKSNVPNYELELCKEDYISCNIIKFISPLDKEQASESTEEVSPNKSKKSNILCLFDQGKLKPQMDFSLEIYVGEAREEILAEEDGFIFTEEDEVTGLSEEYTEREFRGLEETNLVLEITEPIDDSFLADGYTGSGAISNTEYSDSDLDLIPGIFYTNNKTPIRCFRINGSVVPLGLSTPLLNLIAHAKKDGVTIRVVSAFRPAYNPSIDTKSTKNNIVKASSQEYLYNGWLEKKPGFNLAAKPGRSNHGSGIAIDFNVGSKNKGTLNMEVYKWLVYNGWKYGFIRGVASEEWHFDYLPELAKKGPYAKIDRSNKLYWGLSNFNLVV